MTCSITIVLLYTCIYISDMIIVILTLHICTTACSGGAMLLMLRLWQSGWELIGIYGYIECFQFGSVRDFADLLLALLQWFLQVFRRSKHQDLGAVDARIQQRREQMEAGTFRDEPQDMLDMMLPSFQQDFFVHFVHCSRQNRNETYAFMPYSYCSSWRLATVNMSRLQNPLLRVSG